MDSFPNINIDPSPRLPPKRKPSLHRSRTHKGGQQKQTAWIVGGLLVLLVMAGAYAVHEIGTASTKKRVTKATRSSAGTQKRTKTRSKATTDNSAIQQVAAGKAITVEQFNSVPPGALRFIVEDVFGSPLHSTQDFDQVERYGSNGEIFGGEFVNTYMLAYRLSDRPGRIAVFVFQGHSTNPPLVDKQIQGE